MREISKSPGSRLSQFKLDVRLYQEPRFVMAGPAAVGYWIGVVSFLSEFPYLDGVIPNECLGLPLHVGQETGRSMAERLEAIGLFERRGAGYAPCGLSALAPTPKAPQVRPDLRRKIIARDGLVCGICGEPVADEADVDVDHMVPGSRGGLTTLENLRVTHAVCNRSRRHRLQTKRAPDGTWS